MDRKSEKIQGDPALNVTTNLCVILKEVHDPRTKATEPLLISDETTLLEAESQTLKHWAEHFRALLNPSSTISDAAINKLLQLETSNDLDPRHPSEK
nr:unnamed protein product [Spirometra erinaceieuropaei]